MSNFYKQVRSSAIFAAALLFGLFSALSLEGVWAQTPNRGKESAKRSIFSPPDESTPKKRPVPYRTAVSPFARRQSDNPQRFVFSPKPDPARPLGADPSAAAIWSTLITGNMSPEIVRWHLYQKQMNQQLQAAARTNPQAAERIRESLQEGKRSEYEKMLARTRFSLAPNRTAGGANPEPSGGAIVARLLTGQQNGEIRRWKEQRAVELAAASRPVYPPQVAPQIAPSEAQFAAMNRRDALLAEAPIPPVAQSPPVRIEPLPAAEFAAADPIRRDFLDDGFPAASIRQVAATVPTERPEVSPLQTLGEEELITRPGAMKVYRLDEPTPRNQNSVVALPLPEAVERESWRPIEP